MCRRVPAAEATSKMGEVVFLAQRQPNPRHLRASFMPDTLGLVPQAGPAATGWVDPCCGLGLAL